MRMYVLVMEARNDPMLLTVGSSKHKNSEISTLLW